MIKILLFQTVSTKLRLAVSGLLCWWLWFPCWNSRCRIIFCAFAEREPKGYSKVHKVIIDTVTTRSEKNHNGQGCW